MSRELAKTVIVRDPQTGEPRSLLAGTSPSDELAALVTNPAAWGEEPADEPELTPRDRYEALKKDELEAEVAVRRDAGREVEVAPPGNKPDLVEALLSDDAAQE